VLYHLEVNCRSSLVALPKPAASTHPPLVLVAAVLVEVYAEVVLVEEHTCHVPGQVLTPLASLVVHSYAEAEEESLLGSYLLAVVDSLAAV
jgi:hypothetical protein